MKFIVLIAMVLSMSAFAETQECVNAVNTGAGLIDEAYTSYAEAKDLETDLGNATTKETACEIARNALGTYSITAARYNNALEFTLQGIKTCIEASSKDVIVMNLKKIYEMRVYTAESKAALQVGAEVYGCEIQE